MNDHEPMNENQAELVRQVAAACQAAIAKALARPRQAIALAKSLDASLATLRLVEAETSKGAAGLPAVLQNADAMCRSALSAVLAISDDPQRAHAALAAVAQVAPAAGEQSRVQKSTLPTFGQVSDEYIKMRIEADGPKHPEIQSLRRRRQTFIDICGDRPVDAYFHADLQAYVNKMQFYPANCSKRAALRDKSTAEIIELNRELTLKPIARETLEDGYVTAIRTMFRYGMSIYNYRDPFDRVKIRWPKMLRPPRPREGLSVEVLNQVFREGVRSGFLDEAMLPLLAFLTGRRLGLLAFLQGADFRLKDGVMIAQVGGIQFNGERWIRVPVKTDDSMTFFTLHAFLTEIGFTQWAQQQERWIFEALHERPDPAKYASKVLNRLLRRCGAAGQNIEVFHSLRGTAIDHLREHKVEGRARRLQVGHELGDVHERYGFRALRKHETRTLAHIQLPAGIDWSVFSGLDFDAMARRRRSRGRPRLK